jgi:teichuronic acid biosynthesis glycosyltransferase TuaC
MRILFISRLYNSLEYKVMPFVYEQALALQQKGVFVYIYPLSVNNKFSYITEIINIKKIIQNFKPDIIHAHYGLCGMTANLQRKVPVVTTYHGSDIYLRTMLLFSRLVMRLSKWNIFVSQKCVDISKISCNYSIIPCGVNLNLFKDIDRDKAREILGLKKEIKYILFAGSFDDKVKNPELAQEIVSQFNNMKLIELKGYSREEVNILMHAVDACIMTSHSEGSPQFIK